MLNRMKDEVYILIDPFEIEKDSEKPDFKRRLGVVTLALIVLVVTLVIWSSWFATIKYVIISKFLIIMLRMMIIFIFWLLIKYITP